MKYSRLLNSTLVVLICLSGVSAIAKSEKAAQRVEDLIWADGRIYDTILTGASFTSPPSHSVDILYNFAMSGLEGQRPVSDAWPGNKNYNGGRWWVHFVVFTDAGKALHDAIEDGIVDFELMSAEEILLHEAMGYLTIMPSSVYFSCPLHKSR